MNVIAVSGPVQLVRIPGPNRTGRAGQSFAVRVVSATEVREVFRSAKHRPAREQFEVEAYYRRKEGVA